MIIINIPILPISILTFASKCCWPLLLAKQGYLRSGSMLTFMALNENKNEKNNMYNVLGVVCSVVTS